MFWFDDFYDNFNLGQYDYAGIFGGAFLEKLINWLMAFEQRFNQILTDLGFYIY